MTPDCQNMTMDELVEILAQKTQQFTQLMVYKNFGDEYREIKEVIQHILAEIEKRKQKPGIEHTTQLKETDPA